jgi:hypothetical protein
MKTARLLSLIGASADSAVTLSAIATAAGVSRREVEQAVYDARMEGRPIVTGPNGAWRAQDALEAASMADRLRRRALHQLLTARALRATARRMRAVELAVEQQSLGLVA